MQVTLADFLRGTAEGAEAQSIVRSCVHCGFCTATCPTYQLLGDELDGPRGRIYLIKQMLEGAPVSERTRIHLDRCLGCRSCETTCPSGVRYGRLLDLGRALIEQRAPRGVFDRARRLAVRGAFSRPALAGLLLRAGRLARPLLPRALAAKVAPAPPPAGQWPAPRHARRMVVLEGCVQPALAPAINAAAARVLDRLGISLLCAPRAGCCGALSYHLDARQAALEAMRRNVNAWWPMLEDGVEAVVMTASGCGAMVAEYGHLLAGEPAYAARAQRVSERARDLSEILQAELARPGARERLGPVRGGPVAFHPPCTLQHGLRIRGVVESMLRDAGLELTAVRDAHLCCGSAGTYSLLQPRIAARLLADKVAALEAGAPRAVLTANIGCLAHLQSGTRTPVRHWIEAFDAGSVDF
jgi:glycolate oxidase iron-sulfur subunit